MGSGASSLQSWWELGREHDVQAREAARPLRRRVLGQTQGDEELWEEDVTFGRQCFLGAMTKGLFFAGLSGAAALWAVKNRGRVIKTLVVPPAALVAGYVSLEVASHRCETTWLASESPWARQARQALPDHHPVVQRLRDAGYSK